MRPNKPGGLRREVALRYLANWNLVGAPREEMDGYLQESICRLVAVAGELIRLPPAAHVLEVGSNPYYLTLLMRDARPDLPLAVHELVRDRMQWAPDRTDRDSIHQR